MSEHTPTPWRLHKHAYAHVCTGVRDERGIANCGGYSTNTNHNRIQDENLANAAFIVRACNVYEAIKAALNTEEDDDALVEVARNACRAEMKLAAIMRKKQEEL
jgi:hypothetical protein